MDVTICYICERNEYDPVTRTVRLRRDASPYAKLHETAHARQHAENSRCWRVYWACRRVPVLSWATTLLLEYDAICRVKRTIWASSRAEAMAGFWSHALGRPVVDDTKETT